MCSGVIVSSATNAGPGSLTEGALAPFEPPAPAPPSAHASRLAHTIRQAETILSIPCINRSLPQQSGALAGRLLFLRSNRIVKDAPSAVVLRSSGGTARESTHSRHVDSARWVQITG